MDHSQNTQKQLLPILDLFKESFNLYWKKAWLFAKIVLFGLLGILVLLPFGLATFLISYQHSNSSLTLILTDFLLALIGILFCIFFNLWSRVALFCAIKENIYAVKPALADAWPKILSFFWISILVGLAVLGGFILLIIPGIIFSVWFAFAAYAFIFEDIRGIDALRRSKQLVNKRWWPVFGRVLVLWLIAVLVSWIKFFGPIINVFLMAPFSLVFFYVLYQDLKSSKA